MAKHKTLFKVFDWVSVVLLLVGGLNWGLVAFGFDLVKAILGYGFFSNLVYALVGISALWIIVRSSMRKFMK